MIFDITWTSGDAPDLNKSFFEENELSVTPCSLKNNTVIQSDVFFKYVILLLLEENLQNIKANINIISYQYNNAGLITSKAFQRLWEQKATRF